jgi:putative glycosyltransferase (TIGR04372 family)
MITFASLRGESIGHLILNTVRFFSEKKYFFLIIITNPNKVCNKLVYNVLKKNYSNYKTVFIENYFLSVCVEFLYKIQKKIRIFSIFYSNIRWIHHDNPRLDFGSPYRFCDNFLNKKKKIYIDNSSSKLFNTWKIENNIKKKFVCIFSRDSKFHHENFDNPRNFLFSTYKKTIQKLIKLDFTIIRMGRNIGDKFFLKDPNFKIFDQLIEKYEKDYIEILELNLFKNCQFIVGSSSGIHSYSLLFDKLFFMVNHFPAGRIPYFKNCFYISKKYQMNGKYVPYSRINPSVLLSEDKSILKKYGYKIINNTEKEIYEFIIKGILKRKSISMRNKNFIIEGEGAKCDFNWYKKNIKLFSQN